MICPGFMNLSGYLSLLLLFQVSSWRCVLKDVDKYSSPHISGFLKSWMHCSVSIVCDINRFWSKMKYIKIHLVHHWHENHTNRCHSSWEIAGLCQIYGTTHAAIIIISASLEGLLSSTSRFIILSDLMSRLQPRKKMPKTTVNDSTQRTAICTKRMKNWSRSSWIGEPNPSLVITEKLQHPRTLSKGCFAEEIVRFSSPCETFMSSFLCRV